MSLEKRKLYSERNGFKPLSKALIMREIPISLRNAICSCYDRLYNYMRVNLSSERYYYDMQQYIWAKFLNKRESEYCYHSNTITLFIENRGYQWYEKFDIIEESLSYLRMFDEKHNNLVSCFNYLKNDLNSEFERLNVGHRIVDEYITDIISDEEISAVESAVEKSDDQVKEHLQNAIMLYSQRPDADYRNSIKESISAVEAFCRKKTSENTLGKALKKMEDNGLPIHPNLKSAFVQLYAYTNDGNTGIRHSLIEAEYIPSNAEALFMIVSCSALINYLEELSNKH